MTTKVDTTDAYELFEGAHESSSAPSSSEDPSTSVLEVVTRILGYDVFAARTLAEGYREYDQEALHFAESNLAAANEAFEHGTE